MGTACKDCCNLVLGDYKNVVGGAPPPDRPPIWHQMRCKANPLPKEFDPYSGQMVEHDPPYGFCREMNRGNCASFNKRTWCR
jgi:hypothetical protein